MKYDTEKIQPRHLKDLILHNPQQFFRVSPNGEFQVIALHREFLKASFSSSFPLQPEYVLLSTKAKVHSGIAKGYQINFEDLFKEQNISIRTNESFFDWVNRQKKNISEEKRKLLFPISILSHIVYATEFCMLEIATRDLYIRQVFVNGNIVAPCEITIKKENPNLDPYLGIWFIPNKQIFTNLIISPKQYAKILQDNRPTRWISENVKISHVQSHDHGFDVWFRAVDS
ncbi:MAG: hypothetical protein AAF490_26005 [Chloroflexota bacterium]